MLSNGAQGAKVFADRYRRLGRLGTGGMASVFLAKDELLGREVAIKRLHSAAPEDLQQRFKREARLGAALNHPNIVAIFDSVTDEDSLYIVMEYVKGEALDARIDRGAIPSEQALAILEQSAAAVDYAHSEDIVHRDIKPSNLLVRDDGVVKLADLGIATAADVSAITASGSVMGTLPYIAPERLRGEDSGPPSDIYSLAAVAFEMLAGRRPIEAKTPEEAVRLATQDSGPDLLEAWPQAPPEAAEIIGDALDPDPSKRPDTATELIDELERALGATGSSNEELAAATMPMAVVRDEDDAAAAEPDEDFPTDEQDVVAGTVPPPPPRPQPAGRARAQPPQPPRTADSPQPTRKISAAAGLAIAACIAVVAAIALAVAGSGGDDGADTEQVTQARQDAAQGNGGNNEAAAAPADTEPEPAPAPEPEPQTETEPPAPADNGEEEVPGVGTAPVLDPAKGAAINNQGYAILQSGDPAGALPYFQEAITYFPSGSTDQNYSFTLYNLGDALVQLGRGEEAIPYLELRLERWDDRDDVVQATLDEAEAQASGEDTSDTTSYQSDEESSGDDEDSDDGGPPGHSNGKGKGKEKHKD